MNRFDWRNPSRISALLLAGILGLAASAHADTIVLNAASGADYDAIGDGWFFTNPPNQPPDGVGDLGGNALAVGLETGVTELRAMGEFPLEPLVAFTGDEVVSATLTFRIDDVIGTFGPGTTFDNTASDPIVVNGYPADGTVDVADFTPAGLTHVQTVAIGLITDASIAQNGAVDFTVDVTDEVRAYLDGGETAIGIQFGTADSPTATSLDGVLPFITVVAEHEVPPEPPVLSKAEQKCQAAIALQPSLLTSAVQKSLSGCLNAALKALGNGDAATVAGQTCSKGVDLANPKSKVAKALGKSRSAILKACETVPPSAINSPCDLGAESISETASCLVDSHKALGEEMIRTQYADACLVLGLLGYADDYPGVCAPN